MALPTELRLQSALAAALLLFGGHVVVADVGAFVDKCTRVCGVFETCFVYEGAEFCAPFCAAGRCNDTTEICMVQGRTCSSAPCIPEVVCQPKAVQQFSVETTEQGVTSACAQQCPLVSAPVCGSNGVTYINECFFSQDQCAVPSLTLAYAQMCDVDVVLNTQYASAVVTAPPSSVVYPECDVIVCSSVNDPVCTSSGTMANLCFWKKAQCMDSSVTLLQRTTCDVSSLMPMCPAACTQEFVPVCGSNGVVYGNECLFRQAKCERQPWGELRARDLSDCEFQVGDSEGFVGDVAMLLVSTVA